MSVEIRVGPEFDNTFELKYFAYKFLQEIFQISLLLDFEISTVIADVEH